MKEVIKTTWVEYYYYIIHILYIEYKMFCLYKLHFCEFLQVNDYKKVIGVKVELAKGDIIKSG